jgi:hypothetical protein
MTIPDNTLLPVGVPSPMNPENILTILCAVSHPVSAESRPDGLQGLKLNFIQACSTTGLPPLYTFLKDRCAIALDQRSIAFWQDTSKPSAYLYDFEKRSFMTHPEASIFEERRSFRRFQVKIPLNYKGEDWDALGRIVSLSSEGMYVEADEKMPQWGDKIYGDFQLKILSERRSVKIIAQVTWCNATFIPPKLFRGFGLKLQTLQESGPKGYFEEYLESLAQSHKEK